jgi:hypothetical protein
VVNRKHASRVKRSFGTRVEKVDGGYIIEGNKAFATSAGGAQWAILLVNTAGPGGVRHAMPFTRHATDDGVQSFRSVVEIDTSWWDPIGCARPRVIWSTFAHVHSRSDVIGIPDSI